MTNVANVYSSHRTPMIFTWDSSWTTPSAPTHDESMLYEVVPP